MDFSGLRGLRGAGMQVAEAGPMLLGRPTRRLARKRARAGFTMVELMISIAIIGIMAMAIAPSLVEVLADNRHANANWDLVRFARDARQHTLAYGQSSLLRFQRSEANGLGTIQRFTGMTNNCRQTAWGSLFGVGIPSPSGTRIFDMTAFNPNVESVDDESHPVIRLQAFDVEANGVVERPALQICYSANGTTWFSYTAAAGALAEQRDDIFFRMTRQVGGIARGVPREVLFRTAATARPR